MEVRVEVAPGVGLAVRRHPGPGSPYLLVHGLSSNARLWDGTAARLAAAGHDVYAVDLRSHGGSDRPPGGYDTATAAADLDAVCAGLGLAPAVVAGQSWGGNVVVEFAARFPTRVTALVLVDGGWLTLRDDFPSWEACEARLRPADLNGFAAAELRARLRQGHPDWEPWAVEATVANLRELPDGTLERRLPIPEHLSILRSMWDDPPAPWAARVTVPVLLVPAGDKNIPVTFPDARIRAYPGADHDLHAQHPAELAADMLEMSGGTS